MESGWDSRPLGTSKEVHEQGKSGLKMDGKVKAVELRYESGERDGREGEEMDEGGRRNGSVCGQ